MYYLKVYQCPHCLKKGKDSFYVVMQTQTGNLLPIEVSRNEKIEPDEIFRPKQRRSHLLDCIDRRMDWNQARREFESGKRPRLQLFIDPVYKREPTPAQNEKSLKEKKFQDILKQEIENGIFKSN